MRRCAIKLIALLLLVFAADLSASDNASLNQLINEAIEKSPKIKMLEAKMKAAKTRPDQNSNLPDPMLTLGFMNLPVNSFSFTQEPMTGKMIALSQAFPFPGRLGKAYETFSKDAEAVKQEIEEEKNNIRMKVAFSYFDLAYVRKESGITNNILELMQSINDVVRAKYEVSEASQQNIFKIELEITRLQDKLFDLDSREKIQLATLNSLVYRDAGEDVSTIDFSSFNTLQETSSEELLNLAKENKPSLKQVKILEEKSKLLEELSDYEFYPNFNLTLQYNQRDEIAQTNTDLDDFFSVTLGFTLPINYGGKKSAKVDEAVYMRNLYQQQYQSSLQMLKISFESSLAKLQSLTERENLIENSLLVQAGENFNSALSSYQVNKVDFLNVVDALNRMLELETNLYRVRADYYKEIAGLEFLTGANLLNNLNRGFKENNYE